MRQLSLLAMLLLPAWGRPDEPAVKLPAKEQLHLYLLIGQSNMAGRGAIEDDDKKAHPRVLKFTADNTWQPATDPLHFDKPAIAGVGLGSTFGRVLADAQPNVTIGLVPCAVGGTPLSRWQQKGDLYQAALKRIQAAMKDGTLKGILWHQGEADAGDAKLAESYAERCGAMIAAWRADTGTADVPFVAGKLGEFLAEKKGDKPSYWKTVNEQIASLPKKVKRVGVVESTGLKAKSDQIHFDSPSLREFGQRYAKVMQELQSPGNPPKKDLPPNFIFINIDDLGYADIGPFGSKINRTPNLDRMANEGRKLTSFYAAPVCSPSRASLMTGCYPKRCLPIPHVLFPVGDQGLSPKEITVAEVLKDVGYATAIVGKWHLGDQPEFMPNKQGFDLHFGLPYSNDMGPAADGVKSDLGKPLPKAKEGGQPPLPLLRNGTVVKRVLPDDQQSLVEIYTKEAVSFITANKDKPFFLYLPHNAVHFPIYPGKTWAGKSPHGIFSDWVEEVDWGVGQVLDAVRKNNLAERTLVIFTSDNGGTPRSSNAPLRGHKGSTLEGGMRVPTIAWWPDHIPAGTATDAITGMIDILPTFAALAGAKAPADRRIDGVNIWPQLAGLKDAPPAHETFYYYRGLQLEAVRHGDWKLHIANTAKKAEAKEAFTPKLFNLKTDIGESKDVAATNPDVVKKLQELVNAMKDDLGVSGPAKGSRELGKVSNPKPIIANDGTIRPEFAPKKMDRDK